MNTNRQFPALKVLLPLLGGMVVWWLQPSLLPLPSLIWLLAFLPIFGVLYKQVYHTQFVRLATSGILFTFLAFCGYFYIGFIAQQKEALVESYDVPIAMQAKVLSQVEKTTYTKVILEIEQFEDPQLQRTASQKMLAYLPSDLERPDNHSKILLHGYISPIKPSANPGLFDNQSYYRSLGVQYQINVRHWAHDQDPSKFWNAVAQVKEYINNQLTRHVGSNERVLVNAILLGDKGGFTSEELSKFQSAGIMHVMAVSGMHVGLVFMILLLFLRQFLTPKIGGKFIAHVIALMAMWAFVFVADTPSSAIRAASMISLYSLSAMLQKTTSSINILSWVALIMILANPFHIAQVGFQLSFMAMLGIVTIYPAAAKKIRLSTNRIISSCQSLVLVTLCAQLALLPLLLFHFGMYPTYSMIISTLSAPLVTLIMGGSLLLLSLGMWIPALNHLVGSFLEQMVGLMQLLVESVEYLPYVRLETTSFSAIPMILLYLLLSSLLLYYWKRNRYSLYIASGLGIWLFAQFFIQNDQTKSEQNWIVYYSKSGLHIDFVDNQVIYQIGPSQQDPFLVSAQNYYRRSYGNKVLEVLDSMDCHDHICRYRGLIQFYGERIGFTNDLIGVQSAIDLDYLIWSPQDQVSQLTQLEHIQFSKLIIPSGMPYYERQKLIDTCIEHQYDFHDIRLHGSFIQPIKISHYEMG